MMPKVIAISGSPAVKSVNDALLRHVAASLDADVEIVSVRDLAAPIYSPDIESDIPADIATLHRKLAESDGNVLASPEYNGSMPSMLKNVVDWLSRVRPGEHWLPGPLLVLGTSPGANGGSTNVAAIAAKSPWWGAKPVLSFSLPNFAEAFDHGEGLRRAEDRLRLDEALSAFAAAMG